MSESENTETPRMVVVEDNPVDVQLLRLALDRAKVKCDLTVFADGEVAVNWVEGFPTEGRGDLPKLIVLDLNLPKKSGMEVLASLGQSKVFAQVPVVILTSSSSPRERARFAELPGVRHLIKPMGFEELVKIGVILGEIMASANDRAR